MFKRAWICATPTLAVEQVDLAAERIQPLDRNCPFPGDERPVFPLGEFTAADVDKARSRASQLADVLGVDAPTAVFSSEEIALWRFADPAHPCFGLVVQGNTLGSPNCFECRGGAALVLADAGGDGAQPGHSPRGFC